MLPLKNRLKKREDFAQTFSRGAYAGSGGLSIKFAPNSLTESRIGFPIGKNYSKKAVVRNRARRVLRATCAQHLSTLKPGFDIIVMIKPGLQNLEFKKTSSELRTIFQKANLLT